MVEEYRNRFMRSIYEYSPTEKTAEFLMSYLYSMVVTSLAREHPDDGVLQSERENCVTLSPMMDMSFNKALRDTLIYASHNILIESMESAFKTVKNIAEVNKRPEPASQSESEELFVVNSDPNAADFDMMDISSIPKIDPAVTRAKVLQQSRQVQPQTQSKIPERESNEFVGDFEMDFDKINGQVPVVLQRDSKRSQDSDGEESSESFQLDGSAFQGDYSKVPEVDISLDY